MEDAIKIALLLALVAGLVYGAIVNRWPPSSGKATLKIAATGLLAFYAAGMGAPTPLVAALVFSAIGDGFIAGDGDKYLLPGMAAFFIAHGFYIYLFWQLGLEPITQHTAIVSAALLAVGAVLVAYLWRSLEAMKLPVLAYTGVIVTMGVSALHLPGPFQLAMLGAFMFILSDVILSFELFKPHVVGRIKHITSPLLWFLYFGGQVLIAEGVTGGLP